MECLHGVPGINRSPCQRFEVSSTVEKAYCAYSTGEYTGTVIGHVITGWQPVPSQWETASKSNESATFTRRRRDVASVRGLTVPDLRSRNRILRRRIEGLHIRVRRHARIDRR